MENVTEEISVKITSIESVKPSTPTPPHLKQFKLSYLNQILPLVPIFPTCGLVFHPASPETRTVDISSLKTTLSHTLTKFYPLAGKINNSTVNCTDDGLPFFEAQASCTISDLLNSTRKLESMTKFLPSTESLGMGDPHVSELTHSAIQVTVFSCGGVSIAWYDIHKLLDGISAVTFFKHWAALASGSPEDDILQPNLEACVSAFPPTTKSLELPVVNVYKEEVERSPTVAKSFIFKYSAISQLKANAVSDKVPKPTGFQAIAGFIWEQALSVSKTDTNSGSVLHVTLDIRPRVNPPLPTESIGNLAVIAVARAENDSLPDLVAGINSAVLEMKEEMKGYQGEDGVEGVMENWSKVINTLVEYKDRAYRLISWSRLGFSDLDFGFGRPVKMIPTDGRMSPFHRNMIILNDYRGEDGDGIEAWLFLEDKEMQILESNPHFLAFASPSL
ncbi:stemmadenine O-acetyltransferase-like [Silene latifolia]|uniref:stemmadenine O-acetyltransferase-like n=1 Tax=Silene latifolia TaxID=37657 RepID=UPI003D78150E